MNPPYLSVIESSDFQCSIIQEIRDTDTQGISFREVLAGIKTGRWAKQVGIVRKAYASGVKDAAKEPKKLLPGILFSGSFEYRAKDGLVDHSGLICADLDHLDERVGPLKERLIADEYVLSAFISPTGSGLKVIFRCDPTKDHENETFPALEKYVADNYGELIDEKCSDVCRVCFVSHDPDLWANDDAKVIPYPPSQPKKSPKEFILPPRNDGDGDKPGHDFNLRAAATVPDILAAHGWTHLRGIYWCRPGKSGGVSATWGYYENTLVVHSSSPETGFPSDQKGFDAFAVYTHLECGGDFKEAARRLGKMGYGKQSGVPMNEPIQNDMPAKLAVENWDEEPAPSRPAVKNEIANLPVQTGRRSLFNFNLIPDGHESILLGDRYLNRGDGAVLVSTSGMGKSSAAIQMAAELALNLGPFGIQGNGPLRSLILQSEDSDGDIAEVAYSLKHVLKLSDDQINTVNDRVQLVTDRVNRGLRFLTHLKKHIAEFKPDLVFINPLQAFMDGDVTESKDLGAFLREGLNSLNEPATFGYIIVHHTTKPAKPQAGAKSANWNEVMYDMAGGAEIINWARAIISLRAAPEEGDFNLVLAKRGRRAGVTRKVPQGTGWVLEPVTTIPLRHAKGRIEIPGIKRGLPLIYWEGREPDQKPETVKPGGRKELYSFNDYRSVFPLKSSRGLPLNQLHTMLIVNKPIQKTTLHNCLKRWVDSGDVEVVEIQGQPAFYRAAL